jgi:hypothetical protein
MSNPCKMDSGVSVHVVCKCNRTVQISEHDHCLALEERPVYGICKIED